MLDITQHSSPPCGDHVTLRGSGALSLTVMAANRTGGRAITQEEIDILSFLHQNIARKLALEAHVQGRPKTHPRVVQATVAHFNLGPTSHQNFDRLVWAVAHDQ